MKVALLHLSDIHLTSKDNPVLKRKEKIFDAIKNELAEVEETFVVLTGDAAYSGLADEYKIAEELIKYLSTSITDYTKKPCRVIVIPGNHDCDFDKKKEPTRAMLLDGLEKAHYANLDDYTLDLCTEPQKNYFQFVSANGYNEADQKLTEHKLLTALKFQLGEHSVIFHCYNTSWHSLLAEQQGKMALPVVQFDKAVYRHNADVIVSLIHHPFNWQNHGSAREARLHLEKYSDFVLSGHEHERDKYVRKSDSDTTYYIESGALQDSKNSNNSEFGLMLIELEKKEFRYDNYEFKTGSGRYVNTTDRAWEPFIRSESLTINEYEFKDDFYWSFLQDPGSKFLHSQTDMIRLSDIFVYPNLRKIYDVRETKSKPAEIVAGDEVVKGLDTEKLRLILVGDEGSGKTAYCKYLYQYMWSDGYIPVYVKCEEVNSKSNIELFMKTVYSLLADQYQNISKESASQLDKAKIIIILDDFQQLKGSGEGRSKFIHNINGVFNHVIITGKSQIFFEPITTTNKEFVDAFGDYTQLSITEFGKDLRYKLIDKWNKIGRIDEVPLNDILRMNDEVMRKMDSIIGKNYLPPYPIYLLTIIQSMETVAVNNPDYSLQGYYYDYLISDSINKAIADKETISFYYNFIAEYVFHLFKQKIRVKPVSRETFEKFYRNYKDVYQINISLENIIVNLVKTRIITVDENSNFAITYNYIYYFFIAKYLSSKIHLEETKVLIREMCGKLYREEYSNIILFLVHLSGDPIVLNEIQVVAKGIFPDQPICKLDVDVHKINGMIERMPDQVIELMDVEKAREAEYQHQTEIETSIKDEAKENANYDSDLEENPVDIIGQIFFAFKTIDILGQVTKKHWGDLPGPRKLELAEETYLLGLRTLNAYLKALGESSVILAEHIKFLIESKHIKDRDKIEQFSKNFIFRMSFMASYGIIKRISNAIGYSKLNITFDELLNKLRCPSVELIDLSIKLDHFKSFPMDDVERIKGATHQKNYLAFLILKNLVMNYLYLFDTTIGTKQKLESLVGIKITNSLLIDNTSNVKR